MIHNIPLFDPNPFSTLPTMELNGYYSKISVDQMLWTSERSQSILNLFKKTDLSFFISKPSRLTKVVVHSINICRFSVLTKFILYPCYKKQIEDKIAALIQDAHDRQVEMVISQPTTSQAKEFVANLQQLSKYRFASTHVFYKYILEKAQVLMARNYGIKVNIDPRIFGKDRAHELSMHTSSILKKCTAIVDDEHQNLRLHVIRKLARRINEKVTSLEELNSLKEVRTINSIRSATLSQIVAGEWDELINEALKSSDIVNITTLFYAVFSTNFLTHYAEKENIKEMFNKLALEDLKKYFLKLFHDLKAELRDKIAQEKCGELSLAASEERTLVSSDKEAVSKVDQEISIVRGGGLFHTLNFLNGISKGTRLDDGGYGMYFHRAHPTSTSKSTWYAHTRSHSRFDVPCLIFASIQARYTDKAHNEYEITLDVQNRGYLKNIRIELIPPTFNFPDTINNPS